uniref:Uncharacterized protein n=1 Tax=Arundo donax TaxID=35708 RepID=A0A0A9EMC7_ARUDO
MISKVVLIHGPFNWFLSQEEPLRNNE